MHISPIEADALQDALDHVRAGDDLAAMIRGYEQAMRAHPDEAMYMTLVVQALRALQRLSPEELKKRGLRP
jgi:hypothetical protein